MDGNHDDQLVDTLKQVPQSGLKDSVGSDGLRESVQLQPFGSDDSSGNNKNR